MQRYLLPSTCTPWHTAPATHTLHTLAAHIHSAHTVTIVVFLIEQSFATPTAKAILVSVEREREDILWGK